MPNNEVREQNIAIATTKKSSIKMTHLFTVLISFGETVC